jgi:hypothetical protein
MQCLAMILVPCCYIISKAKRQNIYCRKIVRQKNSFLHLRRMLVLWKGNYQIFYSDCHFSGPKWQCRRGRNDTRSMARYVYLHLLQHAKKYRVKGKTIPLEAWTGPENSRSLSLPDFKDKRHINVERLSDLHNRKYSWYSFPLKISSKNRKFKRKKWCKVIFINISYESSPWR